jgi:hypothetical protein
MRCTIKLDCNLSSGLARVEIVRPGFPGRVIVNRDLVLKPCWI